MTDLMIGRQIGAYEIVELIGQGGMGNVYLALHAKTKQRAAIKVLRTELAQQTESVQRFFQEAKAINEIRHPHIIEFFEAGTTQQNENFIIMEYLEGEPLSAAIKLNGPFSTEKVCRIGQQICSALASAHRRGFIHRDLKPDNIYLIEKNNNDDFVKVLDFGIAKLNIEGEDKLHTVTGSVLGTPLCMSPEQALGQPIDHRSDIYAVGVILYMMATRRAPLYDANPIVLANMHVNTSIPRPRERNPEIDPILESIIIRCLEKNREARYASIEEVALALGAIEVGPNLYIPPQLSTHSIPVMVVADYLSTPSPMAAIRTPPRIASVRTPPPMAIAKDTQPQDATPSPVALQPTPPKQTKSKAVFAIAAVMVASLAVFLLSTQSSEQATTNIPTTISPASAPQPTIIAPAPAPQSAPLAQSTSVPASQPAKEEAQPTSQRAPKKKKKIGEGTLNPF